MVKDMCALKALIYETTGEPEEVLKLVELAEKSVGSGEVRLRMLAAAVHPSDFGMIGGSYGRLKELPAVAGREGVAEIVEVGPDVEEFNTGTRVMIPQETGTWQTEAVVPAKGLFAIPSEIPIEQAAMATINPPTAWRLLRDAHLEEGDWVIQNAANSAVGIHVIQMAKHLGLKTVNIVRREELIEPLKELGADVVVLEESGYEKKMPELIGKGRILLALNSIGGESAMRMIKVLADGGRHITFGAMSFEKVRFPTRFLIFNNVQLGGFWMDKWYKDNSEARSRIMFNKVFDLMDRGVVSAPVSGKFRLEEFKDAIAAAKSPRLGKILFVNE